MAIRTNPMRKREPSSSIHKTALRTGGASTPERSHRTALSSAPKADVYYRVWPTRLGIAGSTSVGPDRLKTPTSSTRQRPPRAVDSHDQNCARSGSLGFSAC